MIRLHDTDCQVGRLHNTENIFSLVYALSFICDTKYFSQYYRDKFAAKRLRKVPTSILQFESNWLQHLTLVIYEKITIGCLPRHCLLLF